MPVYFDEDRGTYFCKFYYEDWTGKQKQKLKRGFVRKRDAKEWERVFLNKYQKSPDMTFRELSDLYFEDYKSHRKASGYKKQKCVCDKHILPYWEVKRINEITAADVRHWQNIIRNMEMSESYKHDIKKLFSMILNFAMRYYGLHSNPCQITEPIGRSNVRRLDFWTREEFDTFMTTVQALPVRVAFMVLFYTGMRCGELLALTLGDFNMAAGTLSVSKTYHREHGEDIITTPKTDNSDRIITLPAFLLDILKDYTGRIYGLESDDRIFQNVTPRKLKTAMTNGSKSAGIKPIRIHDLRHSHVSLLIDMGFSSFLIAERIGDTPDMVNKVYGHLYPNRHKEVADKLNLLVSQ